MQIYERRSTGCCNTLRREASRDLRVNHREFDRMVNKFGMETRNSGDHHAWLVHEGRVVVRTKRSHGRKPVLVNFVSKQMHLTKEQLSEAASCGIDLDGYLQVLRGKGLL